MKVLICGSVELIPILFYDVIESVILEYLPIDEIVTGGAYGCDQIAIQFAEKHHIKHIEYYPEYHDVCDEKAPLRRNIEMIRTKPDLVLAFYLELRTSGTAHTVLHAKKAHIHTDEFIIHKEKIINEHIIKSFCDF